MATTPPPAGQFIFISFAAVLLGLIGEVLFSLLFALELCTSVSLFSSSVSGCTPEVEGLFLLVPANQLDGKGILRRKVTSRSYLDSLSPTRAERPRGPGWGFLGTSLPR